MRNSNRFTNKTLLQLNSRASNKHRIQLNTMLIIRLT